MKPTAFNIIIFAIIWILANVALIMIVKTAIGK